MIFVYGHLSTKSFANSALTRIVTLTSLHIPMNSRIQDLSLWQLTARPHKLPIRPGLLLLPDYNPCSPLDSTPPPPPCPSNSRPFPPRLRRSRIPSRDRCSLSTNRLRMASLHNSNCRVRRRVVVVVVVMTRRGGTDCEAHYGGVRE